MGRAKREADYRFSILLVSFEGLSDTADRLGYASGEDVWRRAMGFLTQDLGPQDLCCRLSSDEFLLILSGQGDPDAGAVVGALRRRWQPAPGSREAGIKISIGVASYPTHGCRIEELLRAADEALDEARLRNELLSAADARRAAALNTSH